METAGGLRDDSTGRPGRLRLHVAQWGPPMIGGTTDALTDPLLWQIEPQWSLPMHGGMMRCRNQDLSGAECRRNGARR
jgi:hypothetical protein